MLACVYIAFLTQTYYWDGVLFALNIEGVARGELPHAVLFHPNHLLYSAVGFILYEGARTFGAGIRAITLLQVFNVLVSASATYILYRFSKRITGNSLIALFCSLLFALGATWWKFSTDADSYIISVFFILLTAWFVLAEPPNFIAAGVCHVLAMLFHELAIFTYVPILALLSLDASRAFAQRLRRAVAYGVATGVATAAVYIVCYAHADRTAFPSLWKWITSYASDTGFTRSASQIVLFYVPSYIKLFLGGKLSLVRNYFSPVVCASLLLCLAAIAFATYLIRRPQPDFVRRTDSRAINFLWLWLLSYAIFLACWDPASAFHKLFVWPAIVLLAGAYAARYPALRRRAAALVAITIAIGAWNFAAFIYPHSHASADPVLVLAQTIDRELPKTATVYYAALSPDDWYLDYFAPGRFWSQMNIQDGHAYIGMTNHPARPVCFETTALSALAKNPAFLTRIDAGRRWELVNAGHNVRLECLK